jgi:hypothetical protein
MWINIQNCHVQSMYHRCTKPNQYQLQTNIIQTNIVIPWISNAYPNPIPLPSGLVNPTPILYHVLTHPTRTKCLHTPCYRTYSNTNVIPIYSVLTYPNPNALPIYPDMYMYPNLNVLSTCPVLTYPYPKPTPLYPLLTYPNPSSFSLVSPTLIFYQYIWVSQHYISTVIPFVSIP